MLQHHTSQTTIDNDVVSDMLTNSVLSMHTPAGFHHRRLTRLGAACRRVQTGRSHLQPRAGADHVGHPSGSRDRRTPAAQTEHRGEPNRWMGCSGFLQPCTRMRCPVGHAGWCAIHASEVLTPYIPALIGHHCSVVCSYAQQPSHQSRRICCWQVCSP